ncbi:DUF4349 domain-containing protein [Streptomyces sp. cg36]|uniref:DUF4349 domain-containing protein n=1 Tax=Streptomyces sp. cg36 TaxID=3238798 RepID=UPI0034E28E72
MRVRRTAGRRPAAALGAVLLAASLTVAGCSAGGSTTAEKGRAAPAGSAAPGGSGASGKAPAAPAGGAAGRAAQPVPSGAVHIVRTAELGVEVPDVARALDAARTASTAAGGFVGSEDTVRDEHGRVTSHAVLRVPEDRYDGVLAALSGAGKVRERRASAQDVTDQVVDVESRITTQRASIARVRALMDRAGGLSDVVALEGELSHRQADLDSLLAQRASLQDRTSLATITLTLVGKGAPQKDDGGPGVLDAFAGGWRAFVGAARWTVIVLGAVAPFAGATAAGYALWRLVVRARKARRAAGTGTAAGAPDVSGNSAPPSYVSSAGEHGSD